MGCVEQEQQGSATPMDDSSFEAEWASAKSGGGYDSPGQEEGTPANLEQTTQSVENTDTPAVATQDDSTPSTATVAPATQAPQWTPEQVQQWQEKARHFDSVQGNWNQITQKWEAEKLTPLQQKVQQYEQEREAIRNWYIQQQRPEVQARVREQFQQEQAQEQARVQEAQRQQQFRQAQQQLTQQQQALQAQQQEMLRTNIVGSIDGFISDYARESGVPVAELREYVEANNLRETLKRTPLHQIGPVMAGIEHYANVRQKAIAKENAAKAAQAGTYRVEGGDGAGGQSKADNISKMNDDVFSRLWENAKAGVA